MLTCTKRFEITLVLFIALGGLLTLVACTADAERIREANTAAASGSGNSDQLTGKISVFDLRDGDCFNAAEIPDSETVDFEQVELVPCSSDWVYRALNSFVVDRQGQYPGEDYFMAEGDRLCNRLAGVYLFPLPESWELGDRAVACLMEK